MKIRKQKKLEYIFFPHKDNLSMFKLRPFQPSVTFNSKRKLLCFLNNNVVSSLNGLVRVYEQGFGYSVWVKDYFVWYNEKSQKLKIDLRNIDRKIRKHKISKQNKKWFAFSDKIINRMNLVENEDKTINKNIAKNLVELFYKRGFKDFNPDSEEQDYINYYINREGGIDFYHWSDRCNVLRTKTVIEYFKKLEII